MTALIFAARDFVEDEIHQTLITTTQSATWDDWPAEKICIPAWPISSFTSIQYYDADDTQQTLSTSLYRTALTDYPAYVMPEIDQDWPDVKLDKIEGVTLTWVAGYGSSESDIPQQIRHLLKLIVGLWFLNREGVTGMNVNALPFSIQHLIYQNRVNEFTEFRMQ